MQKIINRLLKRGKVWSSHRSHRPIQLKRFLRQVDVNFGGTSDFRGDIIINLPSATRLSVDKLLMKKTFSNYGIPSFRFGEFYDDCVFPLVLKSKTHRKRRPHLTKIGCQAELSDHLSHITHPEKYYWEEFVSYDREFRIHISQYKTKEVFATEKICRGGGGWVRNRRSCKFHKEFDRPDQWKNIIESCLRVLFHIGLDIGGFDVAYDSESGKHYIIEVNTACGMGKHTRAAYTKELNKIAIYKHFGL